MEKYKADMSGEIEPQITELISRAEKGMKTLQKKHHVLQTKVCHIYSSCMVSSLRSMALVQVETAHSRPQSRPAPGGANRRLQMLMKQSERLEAQLRELESEILTMVSGRVAATRLFHSFNDCHEGSGSETTVDSTNDAVSPYSWTPEGRRTGLTQYPCYSPL